LGNRRRARFWTDKWLSERSSIFDSYPQLASFVQKTNLTVTQALQGNRWVMDIKGRVSTVALSHLCIWDGMLTIRLNQEAEDVLVWRHSVDGQFLITSAYKLFFFKQKAQGPALYIKPTQQPQSSDTTHTPQSGTSKVLIP
jgi:hypothetical protein